MNAIPKRQVAMSAAEFQAVVARIQTQGKAIMGQIAPAPAPYKGKWQPRHKFNAVRTERDGIKFPSKSEAAYYDHLQACQKAGSLSFFLRQVPLHLPGAVLRLDFLEFWADGTITFTDVKGMETAEFKHKRRAIEILYPFKIRTAKQRGRGALRAWEYA